MIRVTGVRVLDLFAGTGALGLEALSRGAAFVLFVDDGAEARALLRQNVDTLGVAGVTRSFRRDATRLGPAHPLEDAGVLALFAGTGALGIEATSRGAKFTLFVDNGAEARALLRNNGIESLGLGGTTKVSRRDATDLRPAHPVEPFSLVFLDPPYGKGLADKALASLRDGGWLTPSALLVVEEAKAAAFAAPEGFEELERRAYDDTEFVFLKISNS